MLDSTSLTLLTPEGMLRVTFQPALSTQQYDELYALTTKPRMGTRRQFQERLAQLANEWGVIFTAEEVGR